MALPPPHGAANEGTQEANARLISAAPDLYTIAQAALTACERVNGVASGVDFCALAVGLRAAIAKAEGKS
uniref:hypothetical protein n=1 Tax=Castellaniella defragrans TaxID=75697 RepID=UPI0033424E45